MERPKRPHPLNTAGRARSLSSVGCALGGELWVTPLFAIVIFESMHLMDSRTVICRSTEG